MMPLLVALIVAATALNGLLAGVSFDGALVKLPARRRIGAVAYATFARGTIWATGSGSTPRQPSAPRC